MSHHRRSQARLQRAIERRRKADAERRKTVIEQANKLLARGDEFAWKPWYPQPKPAPDTDDTETTEQEERDVEVQAWRDAVNSRTQHMPVVDFVRAHSFAELRGQVTA